MLISAKRFFVVNGANLHPLAVLQAIFGHHETGTWFETEVAAVGVADVAVGDGALAG
jgi:hypothetical protein